MPAICARRASCGIRDPTETYTNTDVSTVAAEHPFVVGAGAYNRLMNMPPLELLRPSGGSNGYETISVPRSKLYNLKVVNGRPMHLIPEAVHADGCTIAMCSHCSRGFDPTQIAKRRPRIGGDGGLGGQSHPS